MGEREDVVVGISVKRNSNDPLSFNSMGRRTSISDHSDGLVANLRAQLGPFSTGLHSQIGSGSGSMAV